MRKFVVLMVLVMMSSSAMAEWVEFTRNDTEVGYVNLSSIRKSGNKPRMWALRDYATLQTTGNNNPILSTVFLYEFDCGEYTSRVVSEIDYSKNMGAGEVINSYNNDHAKWNPVVPDSIGESALKIACSSLKASRKK